MAAAARSAKTKQLGDELWRRTDKMNAELFTLTYGALVVQLIKDYEDYAVVNKQLERMGFSMGSRIIEDLLAKTGAQACQDLRDVAEVLAKVGFRSFLNVTPTLLFPSPSGPIKEFSIVFDENPLAEFVELPEDALPAAADAVYHGSPAKEGLWYSNVLCGVVRGALEMIQYQVTATFVSDVLRGDARTEMHVVLVRILSEELLADDS